MTFFANVIEQPLDPIFAIANSYRLDKRSNKVDLTIGIYQDAQGKQTIFDAVKQSEKLLLEAESSKGYLGIGGDERFCALSTELVFGKRVEAFSAQTIGGTGALRLGFEFLSPFSSKIAYIPMSTWVNHEALLKRSGFTVKSYPYFKDHGVDFPKMVATISQAERGSLIVLHASCHNPTGCDLSHDEWQELSRVIKDRHLIPFFDAAYLGLGDGFDEDSFGIRLFQKEGHEMFVAVSYSKNMGLYGERVGCLLAITERKKEVGSTLIAQIRANYSNPPRHGALIAAKILSEETLRISWLSEVHKMRERMKGIRSILSDALGKRMARDFSFLMRQKGMFSLSGLSEMEVKRLIDEFGIYMTKNGRMNLTGLNAKNVDYVAEAFKAVL